MSNPSKRKKEIGPRTLKPWVPHPGALPWVMSFSPPTPIEYNIGLRKPSGGFPAEMFASFKSATMPANVGAEADVPLMSPARPLK